MKLIEALGGEIEYVPHEAGMKGAIERCHELARQNRTRQLRAAAV